MTRLILLFMFAAIGTGLHAARADTYPSHPVKIIVPFAAGGPVDRVARTVAETLSERLKQPFIIENRLGADGNVGLQAAISSKPDGYTLVMATGSMLTVNPALYKKAPFNPEVDLRPISILTVSSQMLVVHPSIPANSLAEFIAFARKRKAPVTYATSGYGSPSHFTMEYLRLLADFPASPVSYQGNAPLMIDLLSGVIKVGFVATSGVLNYLNSGQLKGIGISSPTRSSLAPNVPTIAESGYPGFQVDSYILILAPANVPEPIVDQLEQEVRQAVKSSDFRQKFQALDVQSVGSTGAEAKTWIAKETKQWAKIVKAANMQAE